MFYDSTLYLFSTLTSLSRLDDYCLIFFFVSKELVGVSERTRRTGCGKDSFGANRHLLLWARSLRQTGLGVGILHFGVGHKAGDRGDLHWALGNGHGKRLSRAKPAATCSSFTPPGTHIHIAFNHPSHIPSRLARRRPHMGWTLVGWGSQHTIFVARILQCICFATPCWFWR